MTTREIKRGDVYYIRFDDSYGSEESVGRPILVVSNNMGNDVAPMVTGLSLTTAPRTNNMSVAVKTTNRPSYVLCNQIRTYDKGRLSDYMCTLTSEEMEQIDSTLAYALGLKLLDDTVVEKYERETELAVAQISAQLSEKEKEIAALKDEILAKSVEQDLHKRLYEKSLEMLCEKRLAADLPKVEVPKVEKPPLVDLNNCEAIDLVNIGVDNRVAKMIIASRPFRSVADLQYVTGVTRVGFRLIEKKVMVGDWKAPLVEEKNAPPAGGGKVNVNTATWQELRDYADISEKTAKMIVAHRKRYGRFVSIEDLLNVSRFGPKCLEKSGDKLTV